MGVKVYADPLLLFKIKKEIIRVAQRYIIWLFEKIYESNLELRLR